MKKQIYKNILGLAIMTILLISGIFVYFYNQSIHREMLEQMKMEAFCASAAFETEGNHLEYLEKLKKEDLFRISLIDQKGNVLYDNTVDHSKQENHLERSEIQEALKTGTGTATRLSSTLQAETYYYAVKLSDGMVLRISMETKSNVKILWELLPLLAGVAFVILVSAWFMARRLASGIAGKVNEIDLQNPESSAIFEELRPLTHKIEKQNAQIREQMKNLIEQEEKFQAITKNMSEGLILLDGNAKILFLNPSGKKFLGASAAHYEGKHISMFHKSEQLNETVSAALKGETYSAMLRLPQKQIQFLGNPVREQGQVTGAVIFVMDATTNQRAEQMRKEFSANVSHELKTPLTSISGYAELMQNGLVQREDVPDFAGKIYHEAQRLLALVNDIIKISRLDEKDSRMSKESVDLYQIAEEVCKALDEAAKKALVRISLEGEHVTIFAVRQLMYDLIYNLCENAVKYNVPDGSVSLSVYEGEEYVIIRVSDTGIGIPMEYQERIFERFYRIDKSHSKQTGGTGLGLSIVKHVVEEQGGYIGIHSNREEGTTITVHLQE